MTKNKTKFDRERYKRELYDDSTIDVIEEYPEIPEYLVTELFDRLGEFRWNYLRFEDYDALALTTSNHYADYLNFRKEGFSPKAITITLIKKANEKPRKVSFELALHPKLGLVIREFELGMQRRLRELGNKPSNGKYMHLRDMPKGIERKFIESLKDSPIADALFHSLKTKKAVATFLQKSFCASIPKRYKIDDERLFSKIYKTLKRKPQGHN